MVIKMYNFTCNFILSHFFDTACQSQQQRQEHAKQPDDARSVRAQEPDGRRDRSHIVRVSPHALRPLALAPHRVDERGDGGRSRRTPPHAKAAAGAHRLVHSRRATTTTTPKINRPKVRRKHQQQQQQKQQA